MEACRSAATAIALQFGALIALTLELSCGGAARLNPCPPLSTPQMVADARQLGIPAYALPTLPSQPTADELRSARDRLAALMASFLSAGL